MDVEVHAYIKYHEEQHKNESSRNKEQIASLQATLIWLTRTLVAAIVVGAIALLVRMIVGAAP